MRPTVIGDKDLDIQREANRADWLVDLVRQAASGSATSATSQQEMRLRRPSALCAARRPSIDVIDLNYGQQQLHHTDRTHGQDRARA